MTQQLKGAKILVECLPGPIRLRAGAGKREGVDALSKWTDDA